MKESPLVLEEYSGGGEDKLPSLGVQWIGNNMPEVSIPSVTPVVSELPATQTITYPAQIFGQVPVINRTDTYVSYFEFAYDLISLVELVSLIIKANLLKRMNTI